MFLNQIARIYRTLFFGDGLATNLCRMLLRYPLLLKFVLRSIRFFPRLNTESFQMFSSIQNRSSFPSGLPGDRGSIPGRGKVVSSSHCVQTRPEAHPASCTMGTGGSFPRG
jgi:uncharacterized membrane protein